MPTSASELATLELYAADDATEIFLIDANLNRIASGLGQLTKQVPPGLYKIRCRSGASQHDELIEVVDTQTPIHKSIAPIHFKTAAPIDNTLTTHEYHVAPAQGLSRQPQHALGEGAGLFIFVREEEEQFSYHPPHISVHSLDGQQIASFEQAEHNLQWRWSALNLELSPGTYRIRVTSEHIGTYEIFITAAQDWQTQVFLVVEPFWFAGQSVRAPSLKTSSILMARPYQGFDAFQYTTRINELARLALEQGRQVISKSLMNELLCEKFEDPMLGIIAAHMLLKKPKPNWRLLNTVCGNLNMMLGEHPDVQALNIAMGKHAQQKVDTVNRPPTLRNSWEYIVKATKRRASLVERDSLLAQIAHEIVNGGPWLIHRVSDNEQSAFGPLPSLSETRHLIEQLATLPPDTMNVIADLARYKSSEFTSLERNILNTIVARYKGASLKEEPSEITAQQVLSEIKAPAYAISRAVAGIKEKL